MANQPGVMHERSGLKVIGVGFGRTGTLSLKSALEELGFGPCYHMVELFHKPAALDQWIDITRGVPADWHKVFAGYQATVDWPACTFYQELMHTYPDAKVLLTVRDPKQWYESAYSTIYQAPHRNLALSPQVKLVHALIWEKTFHGQFEDKDSAITVFMQHIEEVKQHVPPEKLLIYDVKEGWEPLCTFLKVEVPTDTPFPHLNDRDNFAGNLRSQQQ